MELVNLKSRGENYYASELLRNKLRERVGDISDKTILYINYSDIEGTLNDRAAIEYFEAAWRDNIVSEVTGWNGRCAFVFGDALIKNGIKYDSDASTLANVEDMESDILSDFVDTAAEEFGETYEKNLNGDWSDIYETVWNFIYDNCDVYPNSVYIDWNKVIDMLHASNLWTENK